jgi:hypothetical protein
MIYSIYICERYKDMEVYIKINKNSYVYLYYVYMMYVHIYMYMWSINHWLTGTQISGIYEKLGYPLIIPRLAMHLCVCFFVRKTYNIFHQQLCLQVISQPARLYRLLNINKYHTNKKTVCLDWRICKHVSSWWHHVYGNEIIGTGYIVSHWSKSGWWYQPKWTYSSIDRIIL